jgi:hypothetical protein
LFWDRFFQILQISGVKVIGCYSKIMAALKIQFLKKIKVKHINLYADA